MHTLAHRDSYRELLKICLSLIDTKDQTNKQTVNTHRKSWTVRKQDGVSHSTTKIHPAVMGLVRHMAHDCGEEDIKSTVYSCALQVSTSPAQVDAVYKHFNRAGFGTKFGKK